jgi:hypothetical protein
MRQRLPNRRWSITEEIEAHGAQRITATISFDPRNGLPAEVFLSGAKSGTEMAAILDDASVVISLALQHGITARSLLHSVSPNKASAIGAALELLITHEEKGKA